MIFTNANIHKRRLRLPVAPLRRRYNGRSPNRRAAQGGLHADGHHGGGDDHLLDEHVARAHEIRYTERHRGAAPNHEFLYVSLGRR